MATAIILHHSNQIPLYDKDVHEQQSSLEFSIKSLYQRKEKWEEKRDSLPRFFFGKKKERINAVIKACDKRIIELNREYCSFNKDLKLGELDIIYTRDHSTKESATEYHLVDPEFFVPLFKIEEEKLDIQKKFALIQKPVLDQLVREYENRPQYSL